MNANEHYRRDGFSNLRLPFFFIALFFLPCVAFAEHVGCSLYEIQSGKCDEKKMLAPGLYSLSKSLYIYHDVLFCKIYGAFSGAKEDPSACTFWSGFQTISRVSNSEIERIFDEKIFKTYFLSYAYDMDIRDTAFMHFGTEFRLQGSSYPAWLEEIGENKLILEILRVIHEQFRLIASKIQKLDSEAKKLYKEYKDHDLLEPLYSDIKKISKNGMELSKSTSIFFEGVKKMRIKIKIAEVRGQPLDEIKKIEGEFQNFKSREYKTFGESVAALKKVLETM